MKSITPADQLANLKEALAHCDKCEKFVSYQPWSVCPHCGWDIWEDDTHVEAKK